MGQFLRVAVLGVAVMSAGVRAEAVPLLQLDIVGGRYDSTTQTVVSNGPVFQLIALFTPKAGETFDQNAQYFVSAALTPEPRSGTYGSFTWADTAGQRTVVATEGMEYGVPPIESALIGTEAGDPGDLPTHGIYPTYFTEFAFTFNSAQRATTYDTAEVRGGFSTNPLGASYYHIFNVNVENLGSAITSLHFDLYDSFMKTQCMGADKKKACTPDEDIDHFAPFSHDAQSGPGLTPPPQPPVVPEPATLVLLATGLVVSARSIRRRPAAVK